ncbi:flotillin family protein [Streptomyces albospinus]|uniref:Flotillin family protein n=1 Tax=Streptomyces albospinus TaxID=285515 RepID=A0ABQ2V194_9ACTN|nr:flotillin family protein [Streptomyces albospinus]GGU61270.1 flotillin family protein [Streptomyces albospinus]
MLFWHVPAPNEALLISGSKRRAGDAQFRIVTGHGCWVMPVKQKASVLSLSLRESEISEDCVTQQGIRLAVRAVAVFKVGDDQASIANAARRFLDEQRSMEELVGRIFAGHLRSIVGGLTVEQIIRERDRVAQEVKEGSHSEMEKLGIVVDALQIQEIGDTTGYITNLAAPHAAAVASAARIAQAKADQEATEREQQAAALKAEYERDTAIKRAGFLAETEQYQARAAQAGPLAQARASQEVIEEQTALAERQAALAARRLEAEVRRPADAEAYRLRTLAEAQRDRVRFEADARAYTEREVARARADANSALAASLRDGNQELIAANRTVENLPALAEAAAKGISGSRLTVLNGTEGVNDIVSGIVGQGLAILGSLKPATGAERGAGAAGASAAAGSSGPEGRGGATPETRVPTGDGAGAPVMPVGPGRRPEPTDATTRRDG